MGHALRKGPLQEGYGVLDAFPTLVLLVTPDPDNPPCTGQALEKATLRRIVGLRKQERKETQARGHAFGAEDLALRTKKGIDSVPYDRDRARAAWSDGGQRGRRMCRNRQDVGKPL